MYYRDLYGERQQAVKRKRDVFGKEITTWACEASCCNTLEAEAGTNGYQGGDAGHGNRVYLRLNDVNGTCMMCRVNGQQFGDYGDEDMEIEIVLTGDSELDTVKEALLWMVSVLEMQSE